MATEDPVSLGDLSGRTAERELRTLQGRQEQERQRERDSQIPLADCAELVPDVLDGLDAERHRVYRLIGAEAVIGAEGSLEVSGDVISVEEMGIIAK